MRVICRVGPGLRWKILPVAGKIFPAGQIFPGKKYHRQAKKSLRGGPPMYYFMNSGKALAAMCGILLKNKHH
jgi:hypothetical protein